MLHLFATEIKPLQLDLGNASGRNETMRILIFILFLFQSLLIASNITFGTIKDSSNNNPLEGVNVTSGQNGISTDKKGQFIIDAESGFLEISHIGFKSLKIPARDTVLIFLIDNVVSSREIVVLSSLSEINLSNSSSSVAVFDKDDIKNIMSSNTFGLLLWMAQFKAVFLSLSGYSRAKGINSFYSAH